MSISEFSDLVGMLGEGDIEKMKVTLDALNSIIYPLEDLRQQTVEKLMKTLMDSKTLSCSSLVIKWAQLVHTLITVQHITLTYDLSNRLFNYLVSLLLHCDDPSEPLYALSALVPYVNLLPKVAEGLLVSGSPLFVGVTDGRITVQRAALDCMSSLCRYVDVSPLILNGLLEMLLQLLNSTITYKPLPIESLLHTKLQFSLLRTIYYILGRVGSIQPLPLLPSLFAVLKALMTAGLPGHQLSKLPLPFTPHPDIVAVAGKYQSPSVAGPRQKRQKRKPGPRGSGHTSKSSSSSSHLSHSGSEGEGSGAGGRKEKWRGNVRSSFSVSSSSESESDSDVSVINIKEVNHRVRLQVLLCLSTVFQSLDGHSTFSYGLPFLPDSPRLPSSPPSLLTCLCKDPVHKCRSAAASVLSSILEGSKPFMAVADDRPAPARPFTPYSVTLGGVVKELHRNLLLTVTAEHHTLTLTHVLKCLSVLVVNAPYHNLTGQYISKILTTIQPLTIRPDIDIAVGSLTCYGAVLCLHPPLPEVEVWLRDKSDDNWPWIIQHCVALLQTKSAAKSLQMEAIQVLTAIVKFYFYVIISTWQKLSDVYCTYMASLPEPLQLHALRLLEEMGKCLSSEANKDILSSVVDHWETLLSGPLTHWLQEGHTCPSSCAQACSVVATMGNNVLHNLRPPTRVLVQTVLLGLSRDENPSVKSSAVRALGVLCQYYSLPDDIGFLLDCSERIGEGLASNESLTVRIQAGWAVGNLTDSFLLEEAHVETIHVLYPSLVRCVITAMKDNEKVKVNAVRAAGNLLKIITQEVLHGDVSHVTDMCSLLIGTINSGGMKTRWNACYACHNALKNSCFTQHFVQYMGPMIEALCSAVIVCKNFKVRTNAALALGSPASYPSPDMLISVWKSVLKAVEASTEQEDFTEYRQVASLRQQLSLTICQLLVQMDDKTISLVSTDQLASLFVTQLSSFVQHHNNDNTVEMVLKRLYQFDSGVPERSKVIQKLIEIFNPPMDIKIDDEKEET